MAIPIYRVLPRSDSATDFYLSVPSEERKRLEATLGNLRDDRAASESFSRGRRNFMLEGYDPVYPKHELGIKPYRSNEQADFLCACSPKNIKLWENFLKRYPGIKSRTASMNLCESVLCGQEPALCIPFAYATAYEPDEDGWDGTDVIAELKIVFTSQKLFRGFSLSGNPDRDTHIWGVHNFCERHNHSPLEARKYLSEIIWDRDGADNPPGIKIDERRYSVKKD